MTDAARIPLSVPLIEGAAWRYVKWCVDTGWISSAGKYFGAFEQAIAELTGARFGVATVNGTAALQVAGVRLREGVIVPNLRFVSSANAVSPCQAVPVLVDVDLATWKMDLDLLEDYLGHRCEQQARGMRTIDGLLITAILPLHVLGNIGDIERLLWIAELFGLIVVEDSTEALGSTANDRSAGTFGRLGTLSFNGNKILRAGGGGMTVTCDETLAKHAKHLTITVKTVPDEYSLLTGKPMVS